MMAGNPNWWSMQYPPSQSQTTLFPPNNLHHHQTYVLQGSSSLAPLNYSFPDAQDPPPSSSWSQLLLGTTITTGFSGNNEDRFVDDSNNSTTLSHHHFQPRKLENWDEEQLLLGNNNSSAVKLPAAATATATATAATTTAGLDYHGGDVKQEGTPMKNNLLYSHPGREEECLQAINRSNNISSTVWSPPQALAMPVVSSPIMSCVTTTTSLGSNNMLDFSYYNNKPVESGNQNTDQSSEGHSTDTRGAVSNKKARVQPSPSQPLLKVRKEKLGDRITALHQLVSPFGKTDTASVLLEAIGYIRFLQSQIEGTVSVRFQIHETSLCIVCSHLASGGRQGDEKYRNSNMTEVLSRTTFPRGALLDLPQKILDHEYILWHCMLEIIRILSL